MRFNAVQAVLASVAILSTAVLAEAIRPRELLASTQVAPDLDKIIPRDFGGWHLIPNVGLVTPSEPGAYLERELSTRIYSQEVARGYTDSAGNVIMFLVAYGPVQNYRLKSHFPELSYAPAPFPVSSQTPPHPTYHTATTHLP